MPATYGSISNTTYGSSASKTVTAPSGIVAAGGKLILSVFTAAAAEAPDPTPPAGFTLISGPAWPVDVEQDSFNGELRIYEKTADEDDELATDYTVTYTTATSQLSMVWVPGAGGFSGATTNKGTTETTTATGLTTSMDDTLLLVYAFDWVGGSRGVPSGTVTWTERLDVANLQVLTATVEDAGTVVPSQVWTNSNLSGDNPWGAVMIAVTGQVMLASLHYSGGASNDEPALSLGGAESSEEIPLTPTGAQAVFPNVTSGQAEAGRVDYFGGYVSNDDTRAGTGTIYITSQYGDDLELAVGVAAQAAGATMATIANATTAPSSVTFTAPGTLETGVDIGELAPGESRGFWLRRTVPAGAEVNPAVHGQFAVLVAPDE